MTELILLLTMWPFHNKPAAGIVSPCVYQDGLWFYAGDDKMIGFSSISCGQAYYNWRTLHIDPVRMSRA